MVISWAAAYDNLVRQMEEADLPKMRDVTQGEWEAWLEAVVADPDILRRQFKRLLDMYYP